MQHKSYTSTCNIYKSLVTGKYCREDVMGRVGVPHHGENRTFRENISHHLQCVGLGGWVVVGIGVSIMCGAGVSIVLTTTMGIKGKRLWSSTSVALCEAE